jgi:succinate-semialdehyde dehydrogenase/glutarate-semialdehyde dehydrogenase
MAEEFTTINPANGDVLDRYPLMSDSDVSKTIESCHSAYIDWKGRSHKQRAEIISSIGDHLRENKAELAELMTAEMGKLLTQSEQEIDLCVAICNWTADNGPLELKSEELELSDGKRGIIHFSPIGIVYGIQPWNFPAYQVVRYAIANLMAGNGVLLKHAANVTGSAKMLLEIFEGAGLPGNLFSVLIIDHKQSAMVIEHELVRGVTLTGSLAAGSAVAEQAGKVLKKTVMELGSNDAYLVLADADLDRAIKACVQGRVYNNGETCIAAKRFIVVDSIYDEFRDGFLDAMQKLKIGDPMNNDSDIGPMAREGLREDLHEQVTASVTKGAQVICGGEMPNGPGFYYPATILENVEPGQPAYDDELFGPVASLIRAKDQDDAVRIANDSKYGLGGGILSKDVEKAIELATECFDTGMVFINGFGLATPEMPFGGVKNSGYGREHGGFGMKEFVNAKAVTVYDR